jgi:thiamine-phosphate diphosphorylase
MICLVTDRSRLADGRGTGEDRLIELVAAAATAGVDLIQIRERDLEARPLASLVRRCIEAVRGTDAKVLVNDRVDVALAAGAHGVHLRSDSIDAPAVRRLLTSGAMVGRSVHSAREAALVSRRGGLDYLILGAVFRTVSKNAEQSLLTLDELSTACRLSAVPILAIGGITVPGASDVRRTGAAGVAAIGLFIPPTGVSPQQHIHTVVPALVARLTGAERLPNITAGR